MHLEQLWSIRDYNVDEIVLHIDVLPSEVTWNETQFIVGNMYLESYLFQARSFIDIYMRYICTIFELGKLGHLSRKKFKKRLRNTPAKYTKKAENITNYFNNNVFAPEKWGSLIKELRDQISHIGENYIQVEKAGTVIEVELYWPTVKGLTFDKLCQGIDTGIFEMLVDTTPILFDLEWKPGQYTQVNWE
jgi:hypothetical protein